MGFTTGILVFADAEELDRAGPWEVQDGNLVTAAGVSAGIDMALWVVGRLSGVEPARATPRAMEYDPAPPSPVPA